MATRYPLVIDTTDGNKIKELPENDNLNLATNNIVNVVNVTASGMITANALSIDSLNVTFQNQSLANVAFSGSYTDLTNPPNIFSGNYGDLQGVPDLVNVTSDLQNVSSLQPEDGQTLIYRSSSGLYSPEFPPTIENTDLSGLRNVVENNLLLNDTLIYKGGFWANGKISFNDLSDTENVFVKGEEFLSGDVQGSVFSNDSTLLIDGDNSKIVGTLTGPWYDMTGSFDITANSVNADIMNDYVVGAGNAITLTAETITLVGACDLSNAEFTSPITSNLIGDVIGSIYSKDSVLLFDADNSALNVENSFGKLPFQTLPNRVWLDYDQNTGNNTRTVSDLGEILQENGFPLYLNLNVSRFAKTLIELNITAKNQTDSTLPAYILCQRSIDNGSNWTDLKTLQVGAVEEGLEGGPDSTISQINNIQINSCLKWVDEHLLPEGESLIYRFLNNTDSINNNGNADELLITYQNQCCIAYAQETF